MPFTLAHLRNSTPVDPSSIATKLTETSGVPKVCGWLWKTFLVPNSGKCPLPGWDLLGSADFDPIKSVLLLRVHCLLKLCFHPLSVVKWMFIVLTNLSLWQSPGQWNHEFKRWTQNTSYLFYSQDVFNKADSICFAKQVWWLFRGFWLVSSLPRQTCCPQALLWVSSASEPPTQLCLAFRGDRLKLFGLRRVALYIHNA